VTIALAFAAVALAICAVAVAQRNARNETIWFALSGLARFLIALGVLVAALFASDHVSNFLIGVFAAVVVCVIAAGLAQLRRTAGETRKLRIFTGDRTSLSRVILLLAAGLLLVLIPGGILFVSLKSFWLATHGGGASIALTGAFLVLVALLVSALVRLLMSAVMAVLVPFRPRARESVIGSSFASIWDSAEALGVVATTALCLSAIGFAIWAQRPADKLAHAASPPDRVRALATASPGAVLTGLAPVLMLTGKDPWPPQRVDAYLGKSTVDDLRGRPELSHPGVEDLRDGCRGAAKPCLLVDAACKGRACSGPYARPVAYGRVVLKDRDSRVSWGISPFRGQLSGIAQWWIFAPYDRWTAPLFIGLGDAVQEHAADWEAVTVGFSRKRPLFVALTSHCGGTWRQYRDVAVADRTFEGADVLGPRLHTLVAYADGSHALYFEPKWTRTPDALGCTLERASGWFRAVSFAANALDVTRDRVRALIKPITGAEAARVLRFPAYWSPSNTFTFDTPLDRFTPTVGTNRKPAGPGSPAKKDLFIDPVRTIFCDGTWHHDPPPDETRKPDLPSATC
jgi:hypothetical protein